MQSMVEATKMDISQLMTMVKAASVKEGTYFDAYRYVFWRVTFLRSLNQCFIFAQPNHADG